MSKTTVDAETVFIPLGRQPNAYHEVPNRAHVLAPRDWPANFLGVQAQQIHPSRYDATRLFVNGSHLDRFVWLSLEPYDEPCWKVDLTNLNAMQLRLYDPARGHLVYRGDIPSSCIGGAVNMPLLLER